MFLAQQSCGQTDAGDAVLRFLTRHHPIKERNLCVFYRFCMRSLKFDGCESFIVVGLASKMPFVLRETLMMLFQLCWRTVPIVCPKYIYTFQHQNVFNLAWESSIGWSSCLTVDVVPICLFIWWGHPWNLIIILHISRVNAWKIRLIAWNRPQSLKLQAKIECVVEE